MSLVRIFGVAQAAKAFAVGLLLAATTTCAAPPVVGSQVIVDKVELPARYNASLPTTIEEMNSWSEGNAKFPPLQHVVDNLAFGQPSMFRRLVSASRLVSTKQQAAWSNRWYDLLEFQSVSKEFCNMAMPHVEGQPSAMRTVVIGSFARDCAKPKDRESILRNDTPSRVVLDYFSSYKGPASKGDDVSYNDRLSVAAEDVILNGQNHEARDAAFVLIDQKDSRAETALLSIYRQLPAGERKQAVGFAFARARSPEGKRIGQEVCVQKKEDSICSNSDHLAGFEAAEDPPKPSLAEIQSMTGRLLAMGFSKVSSINPKTANSASAEVILLDAGYGYGFDVETGIFPNQHDSLLRNLARLVSPALDAAIFEEIAPKDDVGPYELRAYLKGRRYRISAKNLEDWYDVSAALKLLEFMMADQKAPFSLVPLPTNDQTLIVIGGPKAALEQALKDKLIARGDVGRAEELGKGFERDVLKTLPKN
jgi:hypothetical protein